MIKQFLKDSAIYGVGQILTYGITFLLIPFYTQVFTTTDYGVVDLIMIVQRFALLVVALEILQGATRFALDAQHKEDRRDYVSTGFWFSLASYTAFVVVIWLLPESVSQWFLDIDDHQALLRIGSFAIWGQGLYVYTLSQLRYQFKAREYAFVSVVYTVLYVGSIVILVKLLDDPRGVFIGQFVTATLMAATALYLGREDYTFVFDVPKFKEALRFSYPLVFSGIGIVLYVYIDRVLISELLGLNYVGVYAVGAQLSTGMRLLIIGFQLSLAPLVYKHYKEPETPHRLAILFQYFLVIALLGIVGISLFAREIVQLISTPDFYEAWTVIPFLISSTLLANMYIFTPGLVLRKQTQKVAIISIIGGVINFFLNLLLIPIFNIQGAALATMLSSAMIFVVYLYYNQKLYPIPFQWKPTMISIIVSILIIGLGLQLELDMIPAIIAKLALSGLMIAVMFASQMIKIADIVRLYTSFTGR